MCLAIMWWNLLRKLLELNFSSHSIFFQKKNIFVFYFPTVTTEAVELLNTGGERAEYISSPASLTHTHTDSFYLPNTQPNGNINSLFSRFDRPLSLLFVSLVLPAAPDGPSPNDGGTWLVHNISRLERLRPCNLKTNADFSRWFCVDLGFFCSGCFQNPNYITVVLPSHLRVWGFSFLWLFSHTYDGLTFILYIAIYITSSKNLNVVKM